MQYCQHTEAGLEVYQPGTMNRKKSKDYALWRQFNEKPSIIRTEVATMSTTVGF